MIPHIIANWLGLPDQWIAAIAVTGATAIAGWWKYYTSRSADRAAKLDAAATAREAGSVTMQGKALDTLQACIDRLQVDLSRQEQKTERIERDYGTRLEKLERRNGRMSNFIVKLLDAYLQIKAYVPLLEGMVRTQHPDWPQRSFPDINLPNFDEESAGGFSVTPPPGSNGTMTARIVLEESSGR